MITITANEVKNDVVGWFDRASQSTEAVMVVSEGRAKVIMLSVDMFETLIALRERPLMNWKQFQKEFQQALEQAGYKTREDILQLIQDIKIELAQERLGNYE